MEMKVVQEEDNKFVVKVEQKVAKVLMVVKKLIPQEMLKIVRLLMMKLKLLVLKELKELKERFLEQLKEQLFVLQELVQYIFVQEFLLLLIVFLL